MDTRANRADHLRRAAIARNDGHRTREALAYLVFAAAGAALLVGTEAWTVPLRLVLATLAGAGLLISMHARGRIRSVEAQVARWTRRQAPARRPPEPNRGASSPLKR